MNAQGVAIILALRVTVAPHPIIFIYFNIRDGNGNVYTRKKANTFNYPYKHYCNCIH